MTLLCCARARGTAVRRAREIADLSLSERMVLMTLTDYADPDQGVTMSRERLSRTLGVHPQTIRRAISTLAGLGYIEEIAGAGPGRPRTFMPHPERWPGFFTEQDRA